MTLMGHSIMVMANDSSSCINSVINLFLHQRDLNTSLGVLCLPKSLIPKEYGRFVQEIPSGRIGIMLGRIQNPSVI